jgi:hypothetical protein
MKPKKKILKEKLALAHWGKYVQLVADAYENAPDYDGSVVSHWNALRKSNYTLFKRLLSKVDVIFTTNNKSDVGSIEINGREFPIEFIRPQDEYKTQIEMKSDYENTGKLKISIDYSDHPIFSIKDNIVFRTVHDFIVHILGNHGFGAKGEIASYNRHAKMAPPAALPALFTEVVGQACVAIVTNDFPKQKIAVLDGFDYKQVGKVDGYDIKNKALSKDGKIFKDTKKDKDKDFTAIKSENSKLNEMPLPADWDMYRFSADTSFKKRLDYALEYTKERIGGGSSRVAYNLMYDGRRTVLKVARNKKGLAQNQAEIDILDDLYVPDIVIPLIDYDQQNRNPLWIHTERAEKATKKQLCNLMKCGSLEEVVKLANYQADVGSEYQKMNLGGYTERRREAGDSEDDIETTIWYVDELSKLAVDWDVNLMDFNRASNWGIYKGKPVVIDVGFTQDVAKQHYSK